MPPYFIPEAEAGPAIPLHLATKAGWKAVEGTPVGEIAKQAGFEAGLGDVLALPGERGIAMVHAGFGDGNEPLAGAAVAAALTDGQVYRLADDAEVHPLNFTADWADGAYRFSRYKDMPAPPRLVLPASWPEAFTRRAIRLGEAMDRLRDLVNTPSEDMNPAALAAEVSGLGERFGARVEIHTGDALLERGFPMVHAVGRAATVAPRIARLDWGEADAPRLAIIGKGVTFDSGGINMKGAGGARHMKKDMGGAAHAIALAQLVMDANLPVRLTLIVPTVENAVAGNAFRPGDILQTRKGITVEIDNTDAEGRLILGDALSWASEDKPELMIDFATLTGAARVALGQDLAPFYTDSDALAEAFSEAGERSGDPVWRMPLWDAYLRQMQSPVADIVNTGGRQAGSITAALFLKQFADAAEWMHLDIWAWRTARFGRPEGGAACGLRAAWSLLEARYGSSAPQAPAAA